MFNMVMQGAHMVEIYLGVGVVFAIVSIVSFIGRNVRCYKYFNNDTVLLNFVVGFRYLINDLDISEDIRLAISRANKDDMFLMFIIFAISTILYPFEVLLWIYDYYIRHTISICSVACAFLPRKKFVILYKEPTYSKMFKIVDEGFVSERYGFEDEDISAIDELRVGDCYRGDDIVVFRLC